MARELKTNITEDLFIRLQKEGRVDEVMASYSYPVPKGSVTAGANQFPGDLTIPPLRAYYITSITITADGPCRIFGNIDVDADTRASGSKNDEYQTVFGSNGGSAVLPIHRFYRENSKIAFIYESTGTSEVGVALTVNGINLTNDLNFRADKTILNLGDSITKGSMGDDDNGYALLGHNHYTFRLRDQLIEDGIDCRVINKGQGGAKTTTMRYLLNQREYHLDVDFITAMFGTNDCVNGGISESTFKDNLKEIIKLRNRINPTADILLMAPPVTDTSDRSPYIADYRTWVQEVANDATLGGTSNGVYFYDASSAFSLAADATSDPNFNRAELSSGSRVHPNENGHKLIYQGVYNVVKNTDFYKDNI